MKEYVLDLGFIAFHDWWQVGIVLIFTILYVMANVIPAFVELYVGIKERDFWYTPLVFMFMLIPMLGSLLGLHFLWDDSEKGKKFLLALLYALIICTIGAVCSQ